MRPIVIGAGRGSRLGSKADGVPKTLGPALGQGCVRRKDVIFICGYKAEVVKARYPEFTYVLNRDWEKNNILASLLYAREHLGAGFVSTYADIVYRGSAVKKAVASPRAEVLVNDTDWRRRYVARSQHPETDAEKMRAEGDRIVELSRRIASDKASGEFIGVTKFTPDGAREMMAAFDEAKVTWAGKTWHEGRTIEKAYLIDLIQEMLERGSAFHRGDTFGGYMEIDTEQALASAAQWGAESAPE